MQFRNALPFTWPGNIDNECTEKQKPGFDWGDLDFGNFFQYKDFFFNGWKCEEEFERKGRFDARTGKKVIGGICTSDRKNSPSFGSGPVVDRFSLGSIHVKPEFDCDLEFIYDMPDGSTCKHRSFCRKTGTTVVNRQCGGAKNVTIVYPPQPDKPKPSCSIKVPTISFDCETASSTKPPKTKTKTPPGPITTTSDVEATTTSDVETTPTSDVETTPTSDVETTSTPDVETPSSSEPPADTTDITTSPTPGPGTTPPFPIPGNSSSTAPVEESSSASSSVVVPPTSSHVTKTITTSYDSTSTIFTTSTQTITQCEPTVTECPGDSVTTTIVTVPVSTTICPVTETQTTIETVSVTDTPAPTTAPPAESPSTTVAGGDSSSDVATSSVEPVETLPCPSIVPSCLNTFLFTTGCTDNTDAECYCPDATFVKNVYDCLYAHGETDEIIAEAVSYFQGICGRWVDQNPGIATDATVTTYITVTATPTVAPVYTTIVVDATTVVPCTDDAGQVIPSSSTTVTVSTSMTVPQVDFTTHPAGDVDVIPITTAPAPVVTGTPGGNDGPGSEGPGSEGPGAEGPGSEGPGSEGPGIEGPGSSGPDNGGAITTANGSTIPVPTGTGSLRPTTTPPVIVNVGGRVGASFGFAAAVALVVAVAL